jgi:hypothetical protein
MNITVGSKLKVENVLMSTKIFFYRNEYVVLDVHQYWSFSGRVHRYTIEELKSE